LHIFPHLLCFYTKYSCNTITYPHNTPAAAAAKHMGRTH
jgi:hypothetical protein